ncbi:dTDP-4-dehydrorhamnose reductase [Clostridium coskatii]|uniref:dTDP-4-dehydrorhamnose reductase n=1 Tax=Clostridium coskatii TaxID=1705578 RepID=A0A166STQ4_9CLOT|nr:dTDP-4-dehydrorhamnose reductase [Clostridium coskatii]OAA92761.1 dTDP-4-dehydrorhamnose reductase [Clostridium coskatii]OBR97706.1 dTDP-4-dehydrorhamnose reductase [Clostridium coskatii]
MKILITGGKGQLARQLREILVMGKSKIRALDKIYSDAEVKFTSREELDITKLNDVRDFMADYTPDIIVNCAAYTNVDKCEIDFENDFKVNSLGARNLALASQNTKTKLVHISTDYVFNGRGAIPFRECDLPDPISVYGKTKLLGEQYIRENCSRYFIVRTSWLYGLYGKNFVYTILKVAKEKGHLDVVNDQRGNPTNAEDLAYHLLKLALTCEYGIYHCSGKGECSWYDFACKIVEYAGIDCTVSPMTSEKLNRAAKRPEFSSLDNMMLRCTIGDNMRHWKDALKSFIKKL